MGDIVSINGYTPLVKADVIAHHLSCCEATILRMARTGKIPARTIRNGSRTYWRFNLEEVVNSLESHSSQACAEHR